MYNFKLCEVNKRDKFMELGNMYKAILFLFFVVVCLTAVVLTGLKDSFYSFL